MISSTARDLPEHREQVRLACERAGFAPHDMMEHLTALDTDAADISLRMVERADVYIGIFANRYGYVPTGHDISITEMEYNLAVELNKPQLIFFSHEDHLFTARDFEAGPGAEKLKALKDRIGEARVIAFFKSPHDLRAHAVEALTTLARELDTAASGGDAAASATTLHRKSSIPSPPEPYIAHRYTLLQSRDLVGRQDELNALTDWIAEPTSGTFDARVFCFIAIGGMGKSALTWEWFNQIAPNEMIPLAGRLWWSFYESDGEFENFLIRSLCYVSGESEQTVQALPWHEREARLLRHLNEEPYLFVLDGLERILIAYHRMDASYLDDEEFDRETTNSIARANRLPVSIARSFFSQPRLRQATDRRAGAFLRKLVDVQKSRIVITSRLFPAALQVDTRRSHPGCNAIFLDGLNDDDAIGLWHALGVTGSRAELVPIFRSIGGHPLLAQALAGTIVNYRKAPGNLAQWRADHPTFNLPSALENEARGHILKHAFQGLSDKPAAVLGYLAAPLMPVNYVTVEALVVGPDKACGSAQELDLVLTELEDRGLIGWDRDANRYDVHPLVREVVWKLSTVEKRLTRYTSLEAYFKPMTMNDDPRAAIERYHALVRLGRFDDAWDLFASRLSALMFYGWHAHLERISLLQPVFAEGMDELPSLTGPRRQGVAFGALATSYLFTGQPTRSVTLFRQAYKLLGEQDDWSTGDWHSITRTDLSLPLIDIGSLREAKKVIKWALNQSRKFKDIFTEGLSLQHLGYLSIVKGDYSLSNIALRRSKHIFKKINPTWHSFNESYTTGLMAEMSLQLGNLNEARELAGQALELARHIPVSTIHALLRQGDAALGLLDLASADGCLHHALNQSREVNDIGFELQALIAIAELKLRRGDLVEAHTALDEVWQSAKSGPYTLREADACNVLADIAWTEGDKLAAVDAATTAYRVAWCGGPPYAYHWGLEKAKAHLTALDTPEPVMLAFDEGTLEPIPAVEINPKDEYWIDPNRLE
jgi:tetratricopeptide (TPR) repeat protein